MVNSSRWSNITTKSEDKWTEVVSKKKQHYSHSQNDPFAGMKSCVDYEQEIERLKQLVPKVPSHTHNKKPNVYTNNNNNNNNNQHFNTIHNNPTTITAASISRSNSPDTTHSSDSDSSSLLSDQTVTEEEKLRFLAFVRSWTGDWRKGPTTLEDLSMPSSLWADQSPWNYSVKRRPTQHIHDDYSAAPYSYWQTPITSTNHNRGHQLPIGMGRRTSSTALL
jgi:hypothetical protein